MNDKQAEILCAEFIKLVKTFQAADGGVDGSLQKTVFFDDGIYTVILQRNIPPELPGEPQ